MIVTQNRYINAYHTYNSVELGPYYNGPKFKYQHLGGTG